MKRLEDVLREIHEAIGVVRDCKCESAASLLEMAELELRLKVHNISETELSIFCRELESQFHESGRRRQPENSACGQLAQIIEMRPRMKG